MEQIEIIQLNEPEALNYLLDFFPLDSSYDLSNKTYTQNGIQTYNMLEKIDKSLILHLSTLYIAPALNKLVSKYISYTNFSILYLHLIEYNQEGSQNLHNHFNREDFGFILYLNDCPDGSTIFYSNHPHESPLNVFPKKGKLVIFPSYLYHEGLETNNNKKVLVGAIGLNNRNWNIKQ
jgi:hypothetical protein